MDPASEDWKRRRGEIEAELAAQARTNVEKQVSGEPCLISSARQHLLAASAARIGLGGADFDALILERWGYAGLTQVPDVPQMFSDIVTCLSELKRNEHGLAMAGAPASSRLQSEI